VETAKWRVPNSVIWDRKTGSRARCAALLAQSSSSRLRRLDAGMVSWIKGKNAIWGRRMGSPERPVVLIARWLRIRHRRPWEHVVSLLAIRLRERIFVILRPAVSASMDRLVHLLAISALVDMGSGSVGNRRGIHRCR